MIDLIDPMNKIYVVLMFDLFVMTLIDELFDNWCKCDVESCWNEYLLCNIHMMTMDIEMLVGL